VNDALAFLSRYIQFDTTQKNEMAAAQWLAAQMRELGVTRDIVVHEPARGRGLVVARVAGSEPLRPLILNHHIDVVAAQPEQWTRPPFAGEIVDGVLYGRGALDDKGMGVAFLFALLELVQEGAAFRRPVIFTAVPDEETSGDEGTGWLVREHGSALAPEWVWDEGGAGFVGLFGPTPQFGIATCEKQVHHVRVVAQGAPGHGSMPHRNNPNDKLIRALAFALRQPRPFRLSDTTRTMFESLAATQRGAARKLMAQLENPVAQRVADQRIRNDAQLNAFVRDTISLNVVRGGYQGNVIPERAEAQLDCRLLPDTDPDEFDVWLRRRLGREVSMEVLQRSPRTASSPLDSPFYRALAASIKQLRPEAGVFPLQVPGATDGRYWRAAGIPAYGLSPFILSREDIASIHGIDERISGENLALGVRIAKDLITRLCMGG
jgi:acetylornithine deacetylase/succinyl-diaminopimelate desuccinylase-like protein